MRIIVVLSNSELLWTSLFHQININVIGEEIILAMPLQGPQVLFIWCEIRGKNRIFSFSLTLVLTTTRVTAFQDHS